MQLAPFVPLMRPLLPNLEHIAPYLREIDESRWYTNFGPLASRLETRLADHFALPASCAVLVANGTTALTAALVAVGAVAGRRCLMPSWTFVASAAAAHAANLVPHFVDVDPDTWQFDADAIAERTDLAGVGAVMAVSPFGVPVPTMQWDRFTSRTGIPVVIDAAASFDSVKSVADAAVGTTPVMISLHATKAFGIGEGGLVLSTREGTIERIRQLTNFGIWGSPERQIIGYNGKLSEYHAAVGHAVLDAWPARRAALRAVTDAYADALSTMPEVELTPGYGRGWVSAYCTVRLSGKLDDVMRRMTADGIETRRWWQAGVHRQAAYREFPQDALPSTERIAAGALSVPFSHDMPPPLVRRVSDALQRAARG